MDASGHGVETEHCAVRRCTSAVEVYYVLDGRTNAPLCDKHWTEFANMPREDAIAWLRKKLGTT